MTVRKSSVGLIRMLLQNQPPLLRHKPCQQCCLYQLHTRRALVRHPEVMAACNALLLSSVSDQPYSKLFHQQRHMSSQAGYVLGIVENILKCV